MAEYSISSANLNTIENNLYQLANRLERVTDEIGMVNGLINSVDSKVETVSTALNDLREEFRIFVDDSRRVAALTDAKQNVVILEQKIEKEFGFYESIRRHTVGILQATDINVVKKETITNVTEEMMLSAPRYWLAPALIALSAWLGDDKELAERALKEAMRRDDEKTSLLFCLISKRAGRLDGSIAWLERYFAMQDPTRMERRIIVVLDAFASGLFGADSKGICSDKIRAWLEELSGRSGFVESQREQWTKAISGKKASIENEEFPYLSEFSTTWPKLKDSLEWAKTHDDIYQYFSSIFNASISNVSSISAKIDELLDSLVTNYDNEELPLRKQLRKNNLIIEENGNKDKANIRFEAETTAYETYEDFSQHLTSVALTPESSGALIATQKLAISLSKEWILDAYEDITTKSRAEVPLDIQIEISQWNGSSRDGSNEQELQQSLIGYMDALKEKSLAAIKWFRANIIIAIILGVIIGVIGANTIIVPLLSIAAVAIYSFKEKFKADKRKKATQEQMDEQKNNALQLLNATLAEIVDFRRLWTEKDADYIKVADFLSELKPEQYVSSINAQKIRQII